MSKRAKTLLEHASASAEDVDLNTAALILIDYQNEYVTGTLALGGAEQALSQARDILDAFRAADAPVFHVVHHGQPDAKLFNPKTNLVDIHEAVSPVASEPVIVKSLPNAFSGTDLATQLAACGRTNLVVIGFMTHMCVSSTVRHAAENGFRVTIVAEACTTRDLPDPLSADTNIQATSVHAAALAALSDRFANVVHHL